MLVDFFIIGVQKSGTTALDQYLRAHPQIQMATTKEVHYFDDDSIDWDAPDRSILESQFDWSVPGMLRGEATPAYIYWPESLTRLQGYNPKAKLVVGLRHPSFRAFSQWRMETKRGLETLSFEEAISWQARSRVRLAPGGAHRVFSYIERGLYSPQIGRLLKLFPQLQVFFFRTDDLWRNQKLVLGRIQRFLNLDVIICQERKYIVPVDAVDVDGPASFPRAKLDQIFAEDIRATANLTGLDLNDWLSPAYQEAIGNNATIDSDRKSDGA